MIFVQNETRQNFPTHLLEKAAQAVLDMPGIRSGDITIALVDAMRIRTLNKEFLGIDNSTDVLSFPANELNPETGRSYIGDVVLCPSRAAEQADELGHSLEEEMQLLVVHGVLHLLGHDHAEAKDKEQMWEFQTRVLHRLGIPSSVLHE